MRQSTFECLFFILLKDALGQQVNLAKGNPEKLQEMVSRFNELSPEFNSSVQDLDLK